MQVTSLVSALGLGGLLGGLTKLSTPQLGAHALCTFLRLHLQGIPSMCAAAAVRHRHLLLQVTRRPRFNLQQVSC